MAESDEGQEPVEREHELSENCWCNPVVETFGEDSKN